MLTISGHANVSPDGVFPGGGWDGGVREEDSVPKDNDQNQGAMSDSIHSSHRDTPTKGSPAKETLVTSQVNEHVREVLDFTLKIKFFKLFSVRYSQIVLCKI